MSDADGLKNHRFLVVEDDYLIAADLAAFLEAQGIEVVGPAASVNEALALLETSDHLDGAVLDVNLQDDRVYPVADLLRSLGVPFVFTTGYDACAIPKAYADVPRCDKPIDDQRLIRVLREAVQRH
jgi:CheY-like chemotaxis protein